MTTVAKYTKEILWAAAAKGVAFIFYYGLIFFLTRHWSVETWGNWSAFLALLNIILLVSDQGINTACKRYIAAARDGPNLGGIVRSTFLLRVGASVVYTLVIAVILSPLLGWIGQRDYLPLLERSLLLVVLSAILEYFKSLFEAIHRLRFTFLVNLLEHGGKLLFAIILFGPSGMFSSIVTAFTLAVALAIVGGVIVGSRVIPGLFTSPAPPGLLRQTYLYSLPIFVMSIGGFVALEIDTLMLKRMTDSYQTGIYAAAKNIVMFLPHFSLAFSMGMIPGLAVFNSENAPAHRRLFYRTLGALTVFYILLSLGVAFFALYGFGLFFPPAYGAASAPLLCFIPFVILSGISGYCAHLLDYRGLAYVRSINFAATIALNIGLNLWLIPKWGAVGAAISSMAFAPYCLLNLWQADRTFLTIAGPST